MTTYERHLTNRRLRNNCLSGVSDGKDGYQTKTETRRSSSRSTRRNRTLRVHHHTPTPTTTPTPVAPDQTARPGLDKMDRIDRSMKELAQLLGLQSVGVDEASLLETTVAYFRSFPETANALDSGRRGGRHSDVTPDASNFSSSGQSSDTTPEATPTDAILAGFQDCMEETIRYLVDVEGFSPEDEVVVGLTAHLLQIRAKLDINNDSTSAVPWSSGRPGEGPTECEATTSTQTSPQESSTSSLALAMNVDSTPQLAMLRSSSSTSCITARTLPNGTLARGLPTAPPAHLMTPLTVDTNQYYALPSPLNRTALACAMKPSEPLLTVAQPATTHHALSTYSTAAVSSVTGRPLTATTPSFTHRSAAATTAQQQSYHQSMQLSTNGCLIPCVPAATASAAAAQRSYHGFNLNYVAPYVVAWVRPVQE